MAKRRTYTNEFKARVALEALSGEKTLNELAAEHGVLSQQVRTWKNELQGRAAELFDTKTKKPEIDPVLQDELTAPLFKQIGQLTVELDWLKKKLKPFR